MSSSVQSSGSHMPFFKEEFVSANSGEVDDRKLRAANTNLETVAYALSHDLRSPLRAIDGFAQALNEEIGSAMSEEASYKLNEIRAGVGRMQEMIDKWLCFIRIERYCVQCDRVNLGMLAHSVITELQAAEPQRVVMTIIAPNLIVDGDRVLLRELLQNLIGNAWKFTRSRVDAVIELGSSIQNGTRVYFVRDNGDGLAAAQAHQAFEPFVRFGAAADRDGAGIGLTIAQRIIEAHQGQIWVESEKGKGATFCFKLPVSQQRRARPVAHLGSAVQ